MAKENFCAGRLVLCVVLAVLFGMFAEKLNAQPSFHQVVGVGVDQKAKAYVVKAATGKMKVTQKNCETVAEAPQMYVICVQQGATPAEDFLTVAPKDKVICLVCEVDSVGGGKVFLKDGTELLEVICDFFDEPKLSALYSSLAGVLAGQKLEFTGIDGLTQRYLWIRDVPRDTPVSRKNGDELVKEATVQNESPQQKADSSGC